MNKQEDENATNTRQSNWDRGWRLCLSPHRELCKCYQQHNKQLL